MSLVEAAGVIRRRCPVVLVSRKWDKDMTHRQVSQFMASRRDAQIIQTMTLNDLEGHGWEERVAMVQERLRLAFAHYQSRGQLDPGTDESLFILHISDPQYGDPETDEWAFLTEIDIAKKVRVQLGTQHLHFLAITGGISYSGKPEEYRVASEKLRCLLEHLWPVAEDRLQRVLLVPGNHDVNLKLTAADHIDLHVQEKRIECPAGLPSASQGQHGVYGLAPFRDFAHQLTTDLRWRDSTDLCWVNDSFRHAAVRFYVLNSASAIHCGNPSVARIPSEALDRIADQVWDDRSFGIAISHHGPRGAADPDNVAYLDDWPKVSTFIRINGIRLLLHRHGHKWLARWQPLGAPGLSISMPTTTATHGSDVIRVMAPTTHVRGKKRPANERRGFNVIELIRSDGQVNAVTVSSYILHDRDPEVLEKKEFRILQ